jgi:hypothetical protein
MIARKRNADVFVLGEEAIAGPIPAGEVGGGGAGREPARRERRTRSGLDPFRIDVHGLEGAGASAGTLRPDQAACVEQARSELRGWLRVGGVAVAALVAVLAVGSMDLAKLLGGSARETKDPPRAVAEPPVSAQVPPRMGAPARTNLKRDSRPRPTRGREGETPRPRASSRGRPAAATPSTPAVATPSPPSQGGASGGRDNFGFEG